MTPSNRGASRVARLALERGVATDALASAALSRLAKEIWASLHASPVAFPLGDLAVAWSVLADFSGTWRSAAGPLHIARLEMLRVGGKLIPPSYLGLLTLPASVSTLATRRLP